MIKSWWRSFRPNIYVLPLYYLVRVVGATLRIKVIGYDKVADFQGGKIYLAWHGRTFIAATFFRKKGFWTIISHSNDGRLQAGIFKRFGFNLIRGGSGDGGVRALIESVKVLKKGSTMAFTPDGPLGPSEVVQPGVVLMAKKSGAAIIPFGVSAKWRVLVSSWDRYMIPFPFSRGIIVFGEPIWVSSHATLEEENEVRRKIEDTMCALEKEAEKIMGHNDVD